ncbi:TfoX/Sxy family protein [Azospirillum sp. sgz302134]
MPETIDRLPNLGPYITRRLAEVGVESVEDLRALGAVEAYVRLKFQFGREISLNALWAMDAALAGIDWRCLPDGRKSELKKQIAARS